MESKKFQRTREDFICGKCGLTVRGNGYTNHCPRCLWSKHVDVNPGDREAACGGLMEPLRVELRKGSYAILHRCTACGLERWNRTAENDDFNAIEEVIKKKL